MAQPQAQALEATGRPSIDGSELEKAKQAQHVETDAVSTFEDPVEAKKIIRKIDFRLIPLLMFLYTLTFLDRVNIGNARLWNLEKDLHMSGYDYNIVVLGKPSTSYPLAMNDEH